MNGATLGNFAIYKKLDYIIQINVPFREREKRIIKRKDVLFDKETIVRRDKAFNRSQKIGNKKGKKINRRIENIGTIEDLQKLADKIYHEHISSNPQKKKKTMKEKYGGYEAKKIDFNDKTKINNRSKERDITDD